MAKLYTNINDSNGIIFEKLYTWESPERLWSEKNKTWYLLYSLLFLFLIVIVTLLRAPVLILGIIAFAFLWFLQASIPPQIVRHSITTLGIRTFGKIFKWKNIKHYWFSVKEETMFLNLEIVDEDVFNSNSVRRLSLIIDPNDQEQIFYALLQFVDYGDKDEIYYNFFTLILNGRYIDITNYLADEPEFDDIDEVDDEVVEKNLRSVERKTKNRLRKGPVNRKSK